MPVLYLKDINWGLTPSSLISLILLICSFLIAPIFIQRAIKIKTVIHYTASFYAGFVEEIIFRGIIFGLTYYLTNSYLEATVVSSIAFGVWHLKNLAFMTWKSTIIQVIYAGSIYGPIFAIIRILTGDIYLSIFLHISNDVYHSIAPGIFRRYKLAVPLKYVQD